MHGRMTYFSIFFLEYLLGNNILVAPVLDVGATSREIYLPIGQWTDGNTGMTYEGPIWLHDYSADLYTLPYFIAT